MPLYDYECDACSHQLFDVKQSFNDEALSVCPECGEAKLYRVISGGAHAFVKGTNTIGQLADKNAKNNKSLIQENQHRIRESKPKKDEPWYHKHASVSNSELNKMTNKQKAEYILKGKNNGST
tara:strand:+ start:356 stop:724 length:369 start_codon:yes stop_codon:yes gene_type:complete